MCEMTFVPILIGGRLRNCASVWRILWSKWLRFGESHYTLSLHKWNMLIPAWIDVLAGLCSYLYRRTTKEPCFCETHSMDWDWIRQYHCIIEACRSWFCSYSYRRAIKEPCFCVTHYMEHLIETWWVSLYTITAQLKHVNSSMIQCPNQP